MAQIDIGKLTFTHKGDYAGGTAYVANDVVYYNGSAYIAKTSTTGNLPTSTAHWNTFAAGSGGIWSGSLSLGSATQQLRVNSGASALEFFTPATATSDFVRIVTGKDIPVRYTQSGDSYTDGDVVTISASLKDKDFDPAVGLALHEGSHVKLTDFEVLHQLDNWIQRHDDVMMSLAKKHETIESRWQASDYVKPILKDLLNEVYNHIYYYQKSLIKCIYLDCRFQ